MVEFNKEKRPNPLGEIFKDKPKDNSLLGKLYKNYKPRPPELSKIYGRRGKLPIWAGKPMREEALLKKVLNLIKRKVK